MADPVNDPLKPPDAKNLAREIMKTGMFGFSGHAEEEMAKDGLQATDCLNVLRAGSYEPAEYINGEWRYRVATSRICVVLTFKSDTRLRVVTVWRK
jgi:hypothetical protein